MRNKLEFWPWGPDSATHGIVIWASVFLSVTCEFGLGQVLDRECIRISCREQIIMQVPEPHHQRLWLWAGGRRTFMFHKPSCSRHRVMLGKQDLMISERLWLTPRIRLWNWEGNRYSSTLGVIVHHFGACFISGLEGNDSLISAGGEGNVC